MTHVVEQRVVKKRTAVALALLCIIFIAATLGVVAYYLPLTANQNSQISNLQNQLVAKEAQISDQQNQLDAKQSQVQELRNQVSDLNDIVQIKKTTEWLPYQTVSQLEGSYSKWTFKADYAGDVVLSIFSSTSKDTYVELKYTYYGVHYDSKINVGSGGTASFPILPTDVQVTIGNSSPANGESVYVSVLATFYF